MKEIREKLRKYLSEVKDAKGNWYHGSDVKIEKFEDREPKNRVGNVAGFYFTNNEQKAKNYGDIVTVVELMVNKPFNLFKSEVSDKMIEKYRDVLHRENEHLPKYGDWINDKCKYFKEKSRMPYTGLDGYLEQEVYKSGGYDSVIDGDEIAVFNSEDIKIKEWLGNTSELLKETLLPEEYHVTQIDSLIKILESDKINLSSGVGDISDIKDNKRLYFLSLSRTGNPKLSYGTKSSVIYGRIVFNGDKLNSRYKSKPVDYWRGYGVDEYEDRLFSYEPEIKNISRYINRIEIVYKKFDNFRVSDILDIKKIIELCESRGIDVEVYENDNDLIRRKNNIKDKVKEIDLRNLGQIGDKFSGEMKIDDEQLLSILMADRRYFNDYDLFDIEYEEYIKDKNFENLNKERVYKNIKDLISGGIDATSLINQFNMNLRLVFKSGQGDRKKIKLLTNEFRRKKVNNIRDYLKNKL